MQRRTLISSLLDWFKCYLVPGLVFQSVIVGGGYGTGREVVEFFLVHGPMGGLLGMLVSCLAFSLIMAVAFEFARVMKSYDYRAFFQALLGRSVLLYAPGQQGLRFLRRIGSSDVCQQY